MQLHLGSQDEATACFALCQVLLWAHLLLLRSQDGGLLRECLHRQPYAAKVSKMSRTPACSAYSAAHSLGQPRWEHRISSCLPGGAVDVPAAFDDSDVAYHLLNLSQQRAYGKAGLAA